jgi:hypothetical protein
MKKIEHQDWFDVIEQVYNEREALTRKAIDDDSPDRATIHLEVMGAILDIKERVFERVINK